MVCFLIYVKNLKSIIMKNIFLAFAVLIFNLSSFLGFSQNHTEPEALGLPGDNLNLYAVLDLFQKSETIEAFEKKLNEEDTKINNLDLNNDKKIDFIKVVTEKKDKDFIFILQILVNKNEVQDVAVIHVFKTIDGSVNMQIIGDETLYGKDYVVEPNTETVTANPGYTGTDKVTVKQVVPVASEPIVVYMYSPVYVPYYSPWYWGYYPPYWRPWIPMYYGAYWGYHGHYHGNPYYRRNVVVVNPHYNNYVSHRNTSVTVNNYNRNGNYNATYEGKNYPKPSARPTTTAPSARPINTTKSTTRPVSPTTGQTTRATNATTRPVSPVTTPSRSPMTRPSGGRMR